MYYLRELYSAGKDEYVLTDQGGNLIYRVKGRLVNGINDKLTIEDPMGNVVGSINNGTVFRGSWDIKDAEGNGIANIGFHRKGNSYKCTFTHEGNDFQGILNITGEKKFSLRGEGKVFEANLNLGPLKFHKTYEHFDGRQDENDVYEIETTLDPLIAAGAAAALDQAIYEKSGSNQEVENGFWDIVKKVFSDLSGLLGSK